MAKQKEKDIERKETKPTAKEEGSRTTQETQVAKPEATESGKISETTLDKLRKDPRFAGVVYSERHNREVVVFRKKNEDPSKAMARVKEAHASIK